jgi:hypothetical protein
VHDTSGKLAPSPGVAGEGIRDILPEVSRIRGSSMIEAERMLGFQPCTFGANLANLGFEA